MPHALSLGVGGGFNTTCKLLGRLVGDGVVPFCTVLSLLSNEENLYLFKDEVGMNSEEQKVAE